MKRQLTPDRERSVAPVLRKPGCLRRLARRIRIAVRPFLASLQCRLVLLAVAQAALALIILTHAAMIGWWPGSAGEPDRIFQSVNGPDTLQAAGLAGLSFDRIRQTDLLSRGQLPAFETDAPAAVWPTRQPSATLSAMPAGLSGTRLPDGTDETTSVTATTANEPPLQTQDESRSTTSVVQQNNSTAAAAERATTEPTAIRPDESFHGIDPAITACWLFPLRMEPDTPSQGVFGAGRTSTRLHAGIDLYAPEGTEVFAMTAGTVSQIYLFYESLLAIEVENDDGTTIRYTELTPLVKVGDRVEQGQLLALLKKNSGGSCMLHLEIYATAGTGPLTQVQNRTYLYVPVQSRSYMRRSDLVDPGAVYQLARP